MYISHRKECRIIIQTAERQKTKVDFLPFFDHQEAFEITQLLTWRKLPS